MAARQIEESGNRAGAQADRRPPSSVLYAATDNAEILKPKQIGAIDLRAARRSEPRWLPA